MSQEALGPTPDWKRKGADWAETVRNKIPQEWRLDKQILATANKLAGAAFSDFVKSLLGPEELHLTSLPSTEIVARIADGSVTATLVTTAFCKRAAFAHQLNNCLHDINIDEAIRTAEALDSYRDRTGSQLGPLHGLPISVKDQFHVGGLMTTMGYVGWIRTFEGRTATDKDTRTNSLIITQLQEMGAVFYCKTSVPQTLMLGETHNHIIGSTSNPLNRDLSPGGSSGGEGALLALGGSSVGLGTDIGGSVRIPAAFCGLYAIKPSASRLPYRDIANSYPGQTIMPSAVGMMARDLDSFELVISSLLSMEPWLRDPEVVPIPWRDNAKVAPGAKFEFGILRSDGIVQPHPPVLRAMDTITQILSKAGHFVTPWCPPNHAEGIRIHNALMASDGGADVFKQLRLSGEPLIRQKQSDKFKDGPVSPMSLLDYQQLALDRKKYCESYVNYWNKTATTVCRVHEPVHAIITPVAPHVAVIPGKFFYYGYTEIFNLLDYSCVVIPVTRVDKKIDVVDKSYTPVSEVDKANWEAYDPEIYHDMPVGLQIVGRRLDEERILSIAKVVVDTLNTYHEGRTD